MSDIELRRESYKRFVSSLPKTVSPNMFGMNDFVNPSHQINSFNHDFEFNWSIDQIALLNPCDFTECENPSFFNQVDSTR